MNFLCSILNCEKATGLIKLICKIAKCGKVGPDTPPPTPDLVVSYLHVGEAALNFEQTITERQWGVIHLKWQDAKGKWHQRGMDQLPDASKFNDRKWHVMRDIYYVCENVSGINTLPNRKEWRHFQCEKGGHCAIPKKGTTVYYAVKGTDGRMTSFVPYKFEIERPLGHCKEI